MFLSVDYCVSKCGNKENVRCEGNNYEEEKVVCKCSEAEMSFDESDKACKGSYDCLQ